MIARASTSRMIAHRADRSRPFPSSRSSSSASSPAGNRLIMRHLLVDGHHDSVEAVTGRIRIFLPRTSLGPLPRDLIFGRSYYTNRHDFISCYSLATGMPTQRLVMTTSIWRLCSSMDRSETKAVSFGYRPGDPLVQSRTLLVHNLGEGGRVIDQSLGGSGCSSGLCSRTREASP